MDVPKAVSHFLSSTCEWLRSTGPESDIVLSSRIRLARNLKSFYFSNRLEPSKQQELIEETESALAAVPVLKNIWFFDYRELQDLDRQFLLERHLISREHAQERGEKAVAVMPNEVVSIMILEEDHLRIQAIQSGLNLLEAWRLIDRVDTDLGENLVYSFDPSLGYLTACPTNVGTGLRSSCMLHLAGLVMTKQVDKILQALSKLNLAARGFFGEGTQPSGNFFQFSNQMTLGQREEEIIDGLERVVRQIVENEKEARAHLCEKRRGRLEDQIWRAVGVLKSARLMSSAEAAGLLSLMRLGVDVGFVQNLSKANLNILFLFTQPAHLQKLSSTTLRTSERDQKRAELLRTRLKDIDLA